MNQLIEIYQRIISLLKITKDTSLIYKTSLCIIFVFLLLPDVPDVIREKMLVIINDNYMQYVEYIKVFTMPLISWLIEINYTLVFIMVVLWFIQQVFCQFRITDIINYLYKILLPLSLIISCIILVAPIIYIILTNGLSFSGKIYNMWAFYNATTSWNDLVIACIPFIFASCGYVSLLYDESQREYLEWKNKLQ